MRLYLVFFIGPRFWGTLLCIGEFNISTNIHMGSSNHIIDCSGVELPFIYMEVKDGCEPLEVIRTFNTVGPFKAMSMLR